MIERNLLHVHYYVQVMVLIYYHYMHPQAQFCMIYMQYVTMWEL